MGPPGSEDWWLCHDLDKHDESVQWTWGLAHPERLHYSALSHCYGGVNRSGAAVVCLVMAVEQVSLQEALGTINVVSWWGRVNGRHARPTRDHPQRLTRRARWIGCAKARNAAVTEKDTCWAAALCLKIRIWFIPLQGIRFDGILILAVKLSIQTCP